MSLDRFVIRDPHSITIAPGSSFAWESPAICSPVTYVPGTYRLRPVAFKTSGPTGQTLSSQAITFTVQAHAQNAAFFSNTEHYYDLLQKKADGAYATQIRDGSTLSRPIRDYASAFMAERAVLNRDWPAALDHATFAEQSSSTLSTGGLRGWARYTSLVAQWRMARTQAEFDTVTSAFNQMLIQHQHFIVAWHPDTYEYLRALLPP